MRLNEYKQGTDPLIDEAVRVKPLLDEWCRQGRMQAVSPNAAIVELEEPGLQIFDHCRTSIVKMDSIDKDLKALLRIRQMRSDSLSRACTHA